MSHFPFLIDSSAFYALADARDQAHSSAKRYWELLLSQNTPFVTTLPIVAETATLIRRWLGFDASERFLVQIEDSRTVGAIELLFVNEREFRLARDFYQQFADPKLSFVDVISFAVMTLRDIKICFTFDDHFRQAGFVIYTEKIP
jgi:predicted nucleic acid-binding protein